MGTSVEDLTENFRNAFHLKKQDPASYSPLTLAFLGDAVYEVMIRTLVVERSNTSAHKLHQRCSRLVMASAQAAAAAAIRPLFTPEEEAVYKRGRNARPQTMAKNAKMSDYRMATGLEALVGYLYLKEDYTRLLELVRAGIAAVEEEES